MIVIGMDLSGPSNSRDTAVVVLASRNTTLQLRKTLLNADDRDIFDAVAPMAGLDDVVAGIDAPLSYNVGGGDRPGDTRLRKKIQQTGLHTGSIMPPTMNRMVYLTLRGICVARLLQNQSPGIRIAEVHPGAVMALAGAPIEDVRGFKTDTQARFRLLKWMEDRGLSGVNRMDHPSDHYVAACGAAIGAWQWAVGRPRWLHPAVPPFHPYDYVC